MVRLPALGEKIGAYVLEEVLASGGQGTVYRGRHPSLGTLAAVKILHAPDPSTLARFHREAQTLAILRHPGLVRVADLGRSEAGFDYLVMDYVEGQTLLERVRRGGPLGPREAVEVLTPVAEALLHCHQLGILHRDVKPENILLSPAGPLLVDFGLVRRDPSGGAPAGEAEAQRLTQTGEILGTPSYMAPEQADGSKAKISSTCDVYGLGATLYFTLTGLPPFAGGSLFSTLNKVLNEPPPDPRASAPVPDPLAALCLRALAKEPGDRPSSEEFAAGLRSALAEPLGQRRSGPVLGLALAALCLGLASGAAVFVLAGRRGSPASSPEERASATRGTTSTPSVPASPKLGPSAAPLPQLGPLPKSWRRMLSGGTTWTPRRQPSAIAWQGLLWVFPEVGDRQLLQGGIYTSPDLGGTWRLMQTTFQTAPQRAASVIHQGSLYRLGGFNSQVRYDVRRINHQGRLLTLGGNIPGPQPYTSDMNAVSFGGDLWVLGASSVTREQIPLHERYSNVSYRLEQGSLGPAFKRIPVPEWGPRYGAQTLVYAGRLWVLGGRKHAPGQAAEFCDEVWSTDDPRRGWTRVEVQRPFPKTSHHAACVWRGRMWIAGGSNQQPGPIRVYHSADGVRWEELQLPPGPRMVSSASLVPLDEDSLFLIGGQLAGTSGKTLETTDEVWMLQ